MDTFKKIDFINELSLRLKSTKVKAKEVIDIVQDIILEKVDAGYSVGLDRIGKFKKVVRASRKARNPKTNAIVQVPEKTILTFKRKK